MQPPNARTGILYAQSAPVTKENHACMIILVTTHALQSCHRANVLQAPLPARHQDQARRHAKRALLASSRSIQELAPAPTARLGRIRRRQVRPRRTRARNAPRSRPPRRALEASPVTATAGTRGPTLGHAHRAVPANTRMPRGMALARSVGRMPHLQQAAPSRPAASAMQAGRGQTEGHAQRVHLGRTRTMWGTPRVRRARLMQPQLPRVTRRPTARAIQGITLRQPGAHAGSVLREATRAHTHTASGPQSAHRSRLTGWTTTTAHTITSKLLESVKVPDSIDSSLL